MLAGPCQAQAEAERCDGAKISSARDMRGAAPLRMLRMVPLGLRHICFSPNSFTRASSGVMVAHCRTKAACFVPRHMCGRPYSKRLCYQAWCKGKSTGCREEGDAP